MKKACFGLVLLGLVGGAAPRLAYAQGTDEYPPIITDVTWLISRNQGESFFFGPFGPTVEFDPSTEVAREGDWIYLIVEVSDGDLPDDEIFIRKQSVFVSELSPEPGPVGGDSANFLGPYGGGVGSATIILSFQVPEWTGPSQERLRDPDSHYWDVAWSITIEVANTEEPGEDDPVDIVWFTLFAVENVGLRAPDPPPFADAGADETVQVGSTVELDGSRTFDAFNVGFDPLDPDVFEKNTLNYVWEWISGPERSEPVYPDPIGQPWLAEVTLNLVGVYEYRLFVDDGVNPLPNSDTVIISVVPSLPPNQGPHAVISAPAEAVVVGGILTLDGSPSTDPDGDALNYRWRQTDEVGGHIPPAEMATQFQPLSGLQQAVSTWQAIRAGTYYFMLLVDDGEFFDAEFVSVGVIDSAAAGVAVTGDGSSDAPGGSLGESSDVLPGGASCGDSPLAFALLPVLFWPMRGRLR